MMKALVIQVHPLEESYNAALRDRVLRALATRGGSAGGEGAGAGAPVCYRLARGEAPTEAELAAAQRLVLVYPTWSGGLPAALLEWVHHRLERPASLAAVAELTAVTTHGSSRFVNQLQGEWGRRYLRRELLAYCAPGARFRWVPLYKVDRRSPAAMAAHLDTVERRLTSR